MAPRWPLLRVEVAEESMLPGLRPGDWLIALRTRRIRPGQVVLAWMPPRDGMPPHGEHPARPGFLLVKRATRRVEGGWWLESDNPAAGAVDSNRFGPVGDDLIVGHVLARYWPQFKSRF
jgi:phage repressor protein C with HTH and peptisase S24 domain